MSASRIASRNSAGPSKSWIRYAHAAQPLGDVAVGASPRDDPILAGEPHRLLVEGGQRDARVEYLENVDLLDDLEQVLVVGYRVEAVEGWGT